ncbi:hypothetical protein R50072_21700 [Simiduia litorea]|uniref:diguanylate cyclase domain-containing protein n=1 Tax=Simiduia litorea TaxID=1435348 RepID=UPI0036F32EC1
MNIRPVLYESNANNRGIDKYGFFLKTIKSLKQKIFLLEKSLTELRHYAHHDELTGLANRSLLRDRLHQAINLADRYDKKVGLLLLDLNGFKQINDNYGHHIGDELLIMVAKRLGSSIRATDSVFRYGGDEFLILLPEVDGEQGAQELMSKLLANLSKLYSIEGRDLIITASIGIALYPANGATQYALIKYADKAMYQAKNHEKMRIKAQLS